ncbi:MAG TPA: hypothetical protein VFU76_08980 [Terriglobales bacterium]|nr:hypothetical protein [Terriglobales bacterium]
MKRAVLLAILAAVACLSSCNNYNNNLNFDQNGNPIPAPPGGNRNSKHPISTLNLRAFVTDQFNSAVRILDAKYDGNYGAFINTNPGPSLLQITPDKKLGIVFETGTNTFQGIDLAGEATTGSVTLPSWTEDFIIAPDNDTIYAAVRNAPVTSGVTGTVPGAVEVVGLTAAAITHSVFIPKAHWLALSHNGSKLLVFSDDSDSVTVVNTSDLTTTTVGGFDRPVWGVFSSDDSTAYILNCGAECGGTQASVTALNMSNNTPGASAVVEGATMALLDGGNLYVAGTGVGGGKLDIVSVPAMTVSKSGVSITDGYHWRMLLTNGQLFVGARNCSNTANGCLAIYNTGSGNSILAAAPGDVTGLEAIPNRTVVYVVQGGELVIYDTTTDLPQKTQIDIVGKAYDVRYVE